MNLGQSWSISITAAVLSYIIYIHSALTGHQINNIFLVEQNSCLPSTFRKMTNPQASLCISSHYISIKDINQKHCNY